ncbi:MAG: hypothetical protein ACRDJL_02145 [Actinomycetota bacterium]
MNITDRNGQPLAETTVTVNAQELLDLLQGVADIVEGKKEHLHFKQPSGSELVIKLGTESGAEEDPIGHQLDWYVGPLVLFGGLFVIIGMVTVFRWALGLLV